MEGWGEAEWHMMPEDVDSEEEEELVIRIPMKVGQEVEVADWSM